MKEDKTLFFAVRTTMGQEYNVAMLLRGRLRGREKIYSIAVVPGLRGMVLVESEAPHHVYRLITGLKHVKGMVRGALKFEEVEKFVLPKPVIEIVRVNDVVEIMGGPFIGMRGRVIQVDKSRGEVKVEISEAAYPLPITISADYIRIIQRGEGEES